MPLPRVTIPTSDLRDDTVRQLAGLLRTMHALLTVLQAVHVANTTATAVNTAATIDNSASAAAGGAGGGGGGGLFGSFLGGFSKMLGIASLGLSILSLFRGRGEPKLELTPYQEPLPSSREVGYSGISGLPPVDHEAGGMPRSIPPPSAPPPVQVTVNVSAMDSRSFMDHAPLLAQADRDAMLHMHPINQVVRDVF